MSVRLTSKVVGVDTSSLSIVAQTTRVLKYLEHRNPCVGLAGKDLELLGKEKPELQATVIRSKLRG